MSGSEKLCLKWNDFQANYCQSLRDLRSDQEFADVTIACEGDVQIEAHKIILSASSPFFKSVLKKNKHPHPLLFLKGLKNSLLVSILDFIYDGEVNIAHEDLNEFLVAAEDLKVKGLSEENKIKTFMKPLEKTNEVIIPRLERKAPKPILVPENDKPVYAQEYVAVQPSVKVENHVEEEDYSIIEYDHIDHGEEMQIANDYAKGEQAVQIENMIEKYEGVWTCKQCGKTASQKCNIRTHVETHHLNDFSHHCDVCGKSCRSKNALNVHKSTYHRSKPTNNPGDYHSVFPHQSSFH